MGDVRFYYQWRDSEADVTQLPEEVELLNTS